MRRVLRFFVLGVWAVGCGATTHPGQIGDDGGGCNCTVGQACCGGKCVTTDDDPHNCGKCGVTCSTSQFCSASACLPLFCNRSCSIGSRCCGNNCCATGQICCDQGGTASGNPICRTPINGTCPQG